MTREIENINVIKALIKGESTAGLLKAYTGWGGLREAIYTPCVYRELKNCLSTVEINLIKKTMGNAYYTPAFIVQAIYQYLQNTGFTGGKILEPAAGTGIFIKHMPESMRKASDIEAVELEPISAKILAALYPDIAVKNCGFETLDASNKFDLIVGNPPYGKEKLVDANHPDLQELAIHHYFTAKSMRMLKEGGILAMVLPSFFMDNCKDHARNIIAKEGGHILHAFRLPDTLFESAKVTVDLVFLQKGGEAIKCNWVNTDRITVNKESFRINRYFNENRNNILGQLSWVAAYGRKQLNCVDIGSNLNQRLKSAIQTSHKIALHKISPKFCTSFESALNLIETKMDYLKDTRQEILTIRSKYEDLVQSIS